MVALNVLNWILSFYAQVFFYLAAFDSSATLWNAFNDTENFTEHNNKHFYEKISRNAFEDDASLAPLHYRNVHCRFQRITLESFLLRIRN